jgi:hypothetical protein
MNTIKLKVRGFDEDSQSLLISFGCDESHSESLDNCQVLAYQPTMWPDIADPLEVLKRIAFSGIHIVEMQKIKDQFAADESKVNAYKGLVGETFEFPVSELLAPIESSE